MSGLDVVRAWKDEDYRVSLSAAERAALPDNPIGLLELADSDLLSVAGGGRVEPNATAHMMTMGCCGGFTTDPSGCGVCTSTCWGILTCMITAYLGCR